MAISPVKHQVWGKVFTVIVFVAALVVTPKPPLSGSAKDGLLFIAVIPALLETLASVRTGIKFSRGFRKSVSSTLSALQSAYGLLSLWAIYLWNLNPTSDIYEPYLTLLAALVVSLGVLRRALGQQQSPLSGS